VSVVAADVAECDRAVVRHVPERSALRGIESQPIHDDARRPASCVQWSGLVCLSSAVALDTDCFNGYCPYAFSALMLLVIIIITDEYDLGGSVALLLLI